MNTAAAGTPETPRGLVWVSDDSAGIRRLRVGDDVWICAKPNGHLQATGRDARGRKQYRYHPDWRFAKDADKFERMREFGAALPKVRARVKADLAAPVSARPGRDTVLATIVRLLDTTYVRIGNEEYTRTNRSFGLTTLKNRHAEIRGSRLRLRFRGKSGVEQEVDLDDPRVARVVRRCQAMPGQDLFQYEGDDGERRSVGSADVNDYIRDASGAEFTAKDFRTWHASVHALDLRAEQCAADASCRRTANQMLADVARRLGNTVAVCKKSYVHPRVLQSLAAAVDPEALTRLTPMRRAGLSTAERRLLHFLAEP